MYYTEKLVHVLAGYEMIIANSALHASSAIYYIISYPTRAHGILVITSY